MRVFLRSARDRGGRTLATVFTLAVVPSLVVPSFVAPPGVAAQAVVPVRDVPAARQGDRLIAVAVGIPDDRFERSDERLASARSMAERKGRRALLAYLDAALAAGSPSPARIVAAHGVVEQETTFRELRTLVDHGCVVEASVPLGSLERAVAGAGVRFP